MEVGSVTRSCMIMNIANLGLDIGTLGMTRMQSDKTPSAGPSCIHNRDILVYNCHGLMGHDSTAMAMTIV